MTPRAGILVTGTEVLTGRVTDRNGPWLAERLKERRRTRRFPPGRPDFAGLSAVRKSGPAFAEMRGQSA